jgi:CRISPR-associated protein Csd2
MAIETTTQPSAAQQTHTNPALRHDFTFLFDVTDGNPNGDPDAGNLPRIDPETMQGLVTDVAIKRKIRDWVDATRGTEARFKIYVQNKGIALNDLHQRGYDAKGFKSTGSKQKRGEVDEVRAWMCGNFFDIRTFGAVMTTRVNAGQVRGPVQITFARSVDPIVPLEVAITRVAITNKDDADVVVTEAADGKAESVTGKTTEMGRKAIVPYGLYQGYGFVNPYFAEQTGFSSEDLAVFWEALTSFWDFDHSASRGQLALRGLYVFTHERKLGNAPAHQLFERIRVQRVPGVDTPRSFNDYRVTVSGADLPGGVTLTRLVG